MNLTTLEVHNICFSVSVSLRITTRVAVYRVSFFLSRVLAIITCVSCSLIPRFIQMLSESPHNTWLCYFYLTPTSNQWDPSQGQGIGESLQRNCTGIWRKDYMRPHTVSRSSVTPTHPSWHFRTEDTRLCAILSCEQTSPALALGVCDSGGDCFCWYSLWVGEWGYYCHKDEKLLSLCLLGN